MVQINLDETQMKALSAIAAIDGVTVEDLFKPWISELIRGRAGIKEGMSTATVEAIIADMEQRAG